MQLFMFSVLISTVRCDRKTHMFSLHWIDEALSRRLLSSLFVARDVPHLATIHPSIIINHRVLCNRLHIALANTNSLPDHLLTSYAPQCIYIPIVSILVQRPLCTPPALEFQRMGKTYLTFCFSVFSQPPYMFMHLALPSATLARWHPTLATAPALHGTLHYSFRPSRSTCSNTRCTIHHACMTLNE